MSKGFCRDKLIVLWVMLSSFILPVGAQQLIGTVGLINTPTADMHPSGTFDGGVSLLQRRMMVDKNDYVTGLYYISFTPFSFVEMTFRETLRKTRKSKYDPRMGYYQQDRSTSVRLRPLSEKAGGWWPGVVLGVNDIYSDHGKSEYASVYGVLTRHLGIGRLMDVGVSIGYAHPIDGGTTYDGAFGGVSLSPKAAPWVRLMADYDTRGVNVGASVVMFRHLRAMCSTHEFKGVCGALSYMYTIKY